ncbi:MULTISPECIES: hypothetical protein [unclassified Variovorax]|uniref:hypothetical protein n=1 Tax=unclassified Variovorax TaxID=663243 RepID=UPI00088ADD8D|nr:hypothetical protein [Variovorax sp. CF079]SDC41929.1 hypothetical protein SAMN05444679_10313 [Variovorax sp. CF079]
MTAASPRAPVAGRRELVLVMLRGGLVPLLLVDLVFCTLHVARWLEVLESDLLLLNVDRGAAEWWQYLKASAVAVALAIMSARSRQPVYAAWALVFAYALLDDSLMIHERGGFRLAHFLGFVGAIGLRGQDFGELMVSAFFGVPLIALCWWAHRRSKPLAQSHSLQLLWMFAVLLFFGVVVDMGHVALVSAGIGFRGMNVIEDGGELFAMSLATAYGIGLLRQWGSSMAERQGRTTSTATAKGSTSASTRVMNYDPFDGRSRRLLDPIDPPPDTHPVAVTPAVARQIIDSFVKRGGSAHSAAGATVWVVLAWCKKQGVAYQLIRHSTGELSGFYIEKLR